MIHSILLILHSPIKNPTSVPSFAVSHNLLVNVLRAPRPVWHQHRNLLFFLHWALAKLEPHSSALKKSNHSSPWQGEMCASSLNSPQDHLCQLTVGTGLRRPTGSHLYLPTSAHLCPPLPPAQHCQHHLKQPDWEAHNYSKPTTIAQGRKHVAPKASSHLLKSRMHDAARGWGSRAQPSTWPQEVPLTGKVARGWVPL